MATLERRRDRKAARRRLSALALGLAITVGIAGSLFALRNGEAGEHTAVPAADPGLERGEVPTIEEIVSGDAPIGQELADLLGLSLQPRAEGNCRFYSPHVDLIDGAESGYCVESLSDDDVQLAVIAQALRGHRVTPDELPDIRESAESESGVPGVPVVTIYSGTTDQILGVQFQLDEKESDYEAATDAAEREVYRQQMAWLRERVQELCTSLDTITPEVAVACE